ncbi:hypothetical protein [Ekhidna sp.]
MDKTKIQRRVDNVVSEVALKLGFKDEHRSINYSWGFDRIVTSQINVFELTNSFRIVLSLSRRVNQLETTWEEYSKLLGLQNEENITFNLTTLFCFPELINQSYNHEGTGWISFSINDNGFKDFKETVEYILCNKILPKSEELLDLKKLDHLINDKIELNDDMTSYVFNSNGLIYRRMTLAKITENPLFENICEYHRSYFDQYETLAKNPGYEYLANVPIVFEEVYNKIENLKDVGSLLEN